MFNSLLETMRVVALPMKTNFRGVTVREVALFKGEYGWGEFSPFLEYGDLESSWWLASALEAATQPRPESLRTSIPVNGTIPAITDGTALREIVETYPGCSTFKIKVGDNLNEDLLRIQLVRALRPEAALRLDVNGLWSVEQALRTLSQIYALDPHIEYVEQPCATVEELRELKSRADFPLVIAADEVIRKAFDPFAVDLSGAADVLMVKVQPLGGILRSHAIASHHGLPVVVSSALESAVGISYGLELAASLPTLPFACGLATGALVTRDIAHHTIADGEIALTDLDIDFSDLEVAPERYEWWKNRAMRCNEILETR
jgi:O-succinylbenzoate synthase